MTNNQETITKQYTNPNTQTPLLSSSRMRGSNIEGKDSRVLVVDSCSMAGMTILVTVIYYLGIIWLLLFTLYPCGIPYNHR
jgi:hypothetical protein